jgi:hypothetical protein
MSLDVCNWKHLSAGQKTRVDVAQASRDRPFKMGDVAAQLHIASLAFPYVAHLVDRSKTESAPVAHPLGDSGM